MSTSEPTQHAGALLGFDARERFLEWRREWLPERRESMLYRLDIERPLSVDDLVWRRVYGLGGWPNEPAWTGPVQSNWQDLAQLRAFVDKGRTAGPAFSIELIATTVELSGTVAADLKAWEARLLPTLPAAPEAGWSFRGYDVADAYLLSGLSNCGLDPRRDDVTALRRRWSPELNRSHLFDRLSAATEFRRFADRRVVEHAPFFVFGIWSIEMLNS